MKRKSFKKESKTRGKTSDKKRNRNGEGGVQNRRERFIKKSGLTGGGKEMIKTAGDARRTLFWGRKRDTESGRTLRYAYI